MASDSRSPENEQRRAAIERELEAARSRVETLQRELAALDVDSNWQRRGFYTSYYATTGFLLGSLGAAVSLLANIIGSLVWSQLAGVPQSPLRLIQVYLTFPMGESALGIDNGLTLAIGCCLYLGTGMLYGILFQLGLARFAASATLTARLAYATVFAIVLWLVNFYGILAWLQPLLLGGSWILDLIPWWVAAMTHLAYGWTMAVVYPWGEYVPYRVESQQI